VSDPKTRLTVEAGVTTVESDSLYVALTTLAQQVQESGAFSLRGHRSGDTWTVTAEARPVPRQRGEMFALCGCLTNDEEAHRGDCPAYVTRIDVNGSRYWTRRGCACPVGGTHDGTCPAWAPGRKAEK
jgi:hypothetical protein